jgi:hypothetical protein
MWLDRMDCLLFVDANQKFKDNYSEELFKPAERILTDLLEQNSAMTGRDRNVRAKTYEY